MADETPETPADDFSDIRAGIENDLTAAQAAPEAATEAPEAASPEAPATETPAATPEAAPVEDWKAKFEERERNLVAESNQLAERAYNDLIRRTAAKSAAAYEALTGEKPPPDMFPQAPKPQDPNAKPEDSLKADLAELKAWRAEQEKQAKAQREEAAYKAQLQERTDKLYAATEKHKDVYEHPHFGEQMTALLTNEFLKAAANPKVAVDPAKLADDVAKKFRAAIEWEKQKYVGQKKDVASKIPAGAGAGGGRQPGPVKEDDFDLSTRRGRAKIVNELASQSGG